MKKMVIMFLVCFLFISSVSVVSAQNNVFSTIRHDNFLTGISNNLDENIQREANRLLNDFVQYGTDGGRGSRHLFGGVFELRGPNGARLYLIRLSGNTYLLLAKSDKKTQQRVISYLSSNNGYINQEIEHNRAYSRRRPADVRRHNDDLRRRKQSGYQNIKRKYYIKRWGRTIEVTPKEYAQIVAMYQ